MGTMLALLAGVLGVAAIWPIVAIGLIALWSLLARFADRSVTSVVDRRREHGRRRGDVPLAIALSPWHVIVSMVATLMALVVPAVIAVGATFSFALATAAVTGGDPAPNASIPVVAGCLLGLFMCWWGPGGGRLQRGSGSLLRALTSGRGVTGLVVAVLVLTGVGFGVWAWMRHGQLDWWPWSLSHLRAVAPAFW